MIKKIIRVLLVGLLLCFSFYYTEKSVDLVKYTDPIMKEIKKDEKKYQVEVKEANIQKDEITPGYNGITIDYENSYTKMKRIGKYDKDSLVLKEVKPKVTIEATYDKYIVKGNYLKDTVGLVFLLDENTNINRIVKILDDKLVTASFATTNSYLEKNPKTIYDLAKKDYEVQLQAQEKEELIFAKNTLRNIINYQAEYCYFEKKDQKKLETCKNAKMHSILPTFEVNNFKDLKTNLESGAIIKIKESAIKELPTFINYIKQRGYTLENLTYLLSEDRTLK